MNRADVVIARFPYAGGVGFKVRPSVVVQCDRLNAQLHNTILAMITGNAALVTREPTQFLIDPATPEGAASGLTHPSAVKCENLMTVPQAERADKWESRQMAATVSESGRAHNESGQVATTVSDPVLVGILNVPNPWNAQCPQSLPTGCFRRRATPGVGSRDRTSAALTRADANPALSFPSRSCPCRAAASADWRAP